MKPFEVVSIGLATADTIVSLPAWPDPDGRVVTDPIHRSFGGPAATAAVTLARLGHRAAMVGATGDDEAGTRVRADLAAAGVDVTQLRTLSGATPESVILLDRGAHTRAIILAPGAVLDALPAVDGGADEGADDEGGAAEDDEPGADCDG
jgi:sugar/nucleoside kinase (ribokinase family)